MIKKYKILIMLPIIIGLIIIYLNNKVFTLKRHYPDSGKTDISEYVIRNFHIVFHGKSTTYNEKGNKLSEVNFVNGHIKGESIYYYDNGNIKGKLFGPNYKILQEAIWNYLDGKIDTYKLYDDFGRCFFIVRYDKNGIIERIDGHPLLETYQYKLSHKKQFNIKTDQVLKVGDVLKYKFLVANIPNSKRSFKIETVGVDNSKIKRTMKKVLPAEIDVEEILTKKGITTIRAIVQYKFDDKVTPVLNDTISFDVNVN